MGMFYIKLERHGKAINYLIKSRKALSEFDKNKKMIDDYLAHHKKLIQV